LKKQFNFSKNQHFLKFRNQKGKYLNHRFYLSLHFHLNHLDYF
jgi:hypothetical protein